MITYGSYLNRKEGIGRSALWVVLLDTSIALIAGLIVFPIGFSLAAFDPSSSGPGLIFITLPQLFATLPAGAFFGAAFFVLLALAALTSAISLLEIPVAHYIDRFRWSRKKVGLRNCRLGVSALDPVRARGRCERFFYQLHVACLGR